jgi:endoglucanase
MLATPSVSGDEEAFGELMAELFRAAGADAVEIDLAGNVVARKGKAPTRAVCCHMDTVGYMVSETGEDRATLLPVGGSTPAAVQRAVLHGPKGDVPGLVVDTGKTGSTVFEPLDPTALKSIQLGDRVSYVCEPVVAGGRVMAPYLDNRLGCYLAVRALAEADEVVAVATVAEETTVSGARQVRGALEGVDAVLILDVTYGDAHGEPNPIRLGEGPVISWMDSSVPLKRAVDDVEAAAASVKVKLQREVCAAGGSDMLAFLEADRPMWTAFLGVPSRYNHRAVEVVDLGDVEAMAKVVRSWCKRPAPGTSNKRGRRRR